jgi:hypothetical protein
MNPPQNRVGFEQVLSLCTRHPLEDKLAEFEARTPNNDGEDLIGEEETTVVKISKRAHAVPLGPRAKAYMAGKEGTLLEDEKSHLRADCCGGASTTVTTSLANTTDLVQKSVITDLAESGTAMTASHTCLNLKTYFMDNLSGEITNVTTPSMYVKSAHQESRTC